MRQGQLSVLELKIKKAPILVMIYTFFPAFDYNSHFAFLITIRILPLIERPFVFLIDL